MSDTLESTFALLDACDGWQIIKSTYEQNKLKYLVRIWKTLPGAAIPAGRHGYGHTLHEATVSALARWDELYAEVHNDQRA